MTDTRKAISIRLPADTWRRAKLAAAAKDMPLWVWIASVIEAMAPPDTK